MKTYLKITITLFTIFSLGVLFLFAVNAHSGRTDSNGGHHDNIGGGYHYHHGYPAHQHENGECPYDMKDNTNDTENKSNQTETKPKYTIGQIIGLIICLPFISYILACVPMAVIILILLIFFRDKDSDTIYKIFKWGVTLLTIIISIVLFYNLVF